MTYPSGTWTLLQKQPKQDLANKYNSLSKSCFFYNYNRIYVIIKPKTRVDFWQNISTYACANPNNVGGYSNSTVWQFQQLLCFQQTRQLSSELRNLRGLCIRETTPVLRRTFWLLSVIDSQNGDIIFATVFRHFQFTNWPWTLVAVYRSMKIT